MNQGIHHLIDGRESALAPLLDPHLFNQKTKALCEQLGIQVVGGSHHRFEPYGGFTACVLLAASHITVHTWPEFKEFSADIYLCHHSNNQTQTAQTIADYLITYFGAKSCTTNIIARGGQHSRHQERLSEHSVLHLDNAKLIHHGHTGMQDIAFYEHADFGDFFTLDGVAMASSRDEAQYHEALLAPGVQEMRSMLIIGGGDGGLANRARARGYTAITVCEIDAEVVRLCQRYMPALAGDIWQDPCCELIIGDAAITVPTLHKQYDTIVLDLTDPGDKRIANPLYQSEFLQLLASKMQPGAYLAMHLGSPFYHEARCEALLAKLSEVFPKVVRGRASVPLYGGEWALAFAYNTA